MKKRRKEETRYGKIKKFIHRLAETVFFLLVMAFFLSILYLLWTSGDIVSFCKGAARAGFIALILVVIYSKELQRFFTSFSEISTSLLIKIKKLRRRPTQIQVAATKKDVEQRADKSTKREGKRTYEWPETETRGQILRRLGISSERREKTKINTENKIGMEADLESANNLDKKGSSPDLPGYILDKLVKSGRFRCPRTLHIGKIRGADIVDKIILPNLEKRGINRNQIQITWGRSTKIKLPREVREKLANK